MIWPQRKEQYRFNLKPDEVQQRLAARTQPPPTFRTLSTMRKQAKEKPFMGTVNSKRFRLDRITLYRNSFKPELLGTVIGEGDSTVVTVEMKVHMIVRIIMTIWFVIICLFVVGATIALLFGDRAKVPIWPILLFGGMAVGGWYLVKQAFHYECEKADKLFKTFLKEE